MNQKIELLEKSKNKIISLKYAKQYLRVDNDYDDEIINDMIDVACELAENYLSRKIHQSKLRLTVYDSLPSSIKLLYAPVLKIEKIKIIRGDEVTYLHPDQYFLQDNEKISFKRYIFSRKTEIEYYNGFAEGKVPATIKQGILEHLARLYDSRGSDQTLPLSSKSLYQPYKMARIL